MLSNRSACFSVTVLRKNLTSHGSSGPASPSVFTNLPRGCMLGHSAPTSPLNRP